LFNQNSEAKVRRSTKSTVIRKAKVISYKDIQEARETRAAKEHAATDKNKRGLKRAARDEASLDKGKRGRKRKSPAPKADVPELKTKVARMSEAPEPATAPVAWMSEVQVALGSFLFSLVRIGLLRQEYSRRHCDLFLYSRRLAVVAFLRKCDLENG
jgi:hypothetical protein